MDTSCTKYKVRQCSRCPGDTEYYCISCPCSLCLHCKEMHVNDLKTIDHNVVIYSEQSNHPSTQELCVRHPGNFYRKCCESCELPYCSHCTQHTTHKQTDIWTLYESKRHQTRETVHTIRSETFYYLSVLLTGIKADVKTCCTEFSFYQSEILTKAHRLINRIDFALRGVSYKHRCKKQKIEMNRHLASIQKYEYIFIYEQSLISPIQFLLFLKKTQINQINLAIHTIKFYMNKSLNQRNVIESLSEVQITERGKRCIRNDRLLKTMNSPDLHQSLIVKDLHRCVHITNLTSDRVWISHKNNLVLTNTTGDTLHQRNDLCIGNGVHTGNNECELIYIDKDFNINKLSIDMKTPAKFLETQDSTWRPQCLYWSSSNGDLLVGMRKEKPLKCKVSRYNKIGKLTQTIQHDNTGQPDLYKNPYYITENNNGDVVVSDFEVYPSGAVVVSERGGSHRFSYRGHPSGSQLRPRGICTDALSHILVCDVRTYTLQMIDRDGQFLCHLLIRPSGIFEPYSVSYDTSTHRLWVGSWNKVFVYRYITRQDALTASHDAMQPLNEVITTESEKTNQGNKCLLKLISAPELLHSVTVTGVSGCYHISCVTPDRVWISYKNKLILTNTTGDTLGKRNDLCRGYGVHAVNNESELIYIDKYHNVNKLSNDLTTTIKFIKKPDSAWLPRCVYWSYLTRTLLVGMCRYSIYKVARFNHSGQLVQTIQHDNTGLELYNKLNYITENNNMDIVVSDSGAVVVTDHEGTHLFSYTGHPSGSLLQPGGICTDALSHILVCDVRSNTVQMIDKDGQFLSLIQKELLEMGGPYSLSSDAITHHLWVASWNNTNMCVICYISQHDDLPGEHAQCPDEDVLLNVSSS